MRHIILLTALLALAACGLETGPPGGYSPGGDYNPVSGTRSSGAH